MSSSDHADLEALSAYIDGEAPEWADHVAGCEACRGTAAEFRAVSAAVGRPVEAPAPAVREAAIAAALDALPAPAAGARAPSRLAPDRHEAERARFARLRSPRPWAMPAVAAVVLAALGMAGVILSSYRSSDDFTTATGPALESNKAGGRDSLAGAPQAPVTDLGDVADAATLRSRAQVGAPAGAAAGRASSSASSGAAADSSATNTGNTGAPAALAAPPSGGPSVATGAVSGGAGGVAAGSGAGGTGGSVAVVGTRPCEEQARTREPNLGPVVYFATARRGTVEGYVLGFTPVGASSPVTLLLLAQDGCRELLRAAGP